MRQPTRELRARICARTDVRRERGAFVAGSERLRGLTDGLRSTYWPTYRYKGKDPGVTNGAGGGKRAGMARGTAVDAELARLTESAHRGERAAKPSTYATRALAALERLGLEPCVPQVAVAAAPIGTAVDLLCADQEGKPVCVELKCGFDGYFDRGCGPMRNEMRAFLDSPRWQHMLQLACTARMFARTHGIHPRALLLRITERGAHFYWLDKRVARLADAALARLASRKNKKSYNQRGASSNFA